MDYNALYDELEKLSLQRLIDSLADITHDELLNTIPINGKHITLMSCIYLLIKAASEDTGTQLEQAKTALTSIVTYE